MVAADLRWDPFDRELHVNPYAAWKRMRDEVPVYHNEEFDFYALSRFDDVLSATMDTDTFSSAHGVTIDSIGPFPVGDPAPMIMMDPPVHTSMRKLVNRTFIRGKILELEDHVRELTRGYLDTHAGAGRMDYVQDLSMRLPVMVISSLLGFPEEDHDNLRVWSDAQVHRDEGSPEVTAEGDAAHAKLFGYYADQISARRDDPRDDVVSEMMESELTLPDGTVRLLDDGELFVFIALINVAGNETVARLLGWAAMTLARFPEQRAKLAADPSLIPNAVEELLRYEAPSPVQGRYTTRDVTYHDTLIPAGSKVALVTGAAGRDEREFDDPDTFDVERQKIRHLSFGQGAHFCLGAQLARLEARVALEETLLRFPTWDVDWDAVRYVHTSSVRGPASVPIVF
ncbi:cytochrome P450 [uncultured Williamsia sp.]|uniref:cytochrome P450 n=1 Tax=uncultured Williamsia sp. TaxID=259311 RepID=UPI00260D0E52|nr:cytochrome P450 [uncultured Williamsia sp.]